ncbi:hypothetical protein ACFL3E_02470 [Patescibacteria group bacterium]
MKNTLVLISIIILVLASFFLMTDRHHEMIGMENMDEHRTEFLSQRDDIIMAMMPHGNYRCCLVKPCTYCIEKTPGHGEGATCDCLTDVVEGRHPCGECIGEILEGHGNPYLAEYFAAAIAEEVGEEHLETLQKIITDKYSL